MFFVKVAFLLLSITQLSHAHSSGADATACTHMTPDHPPFQPQTTPAPFTVTTSVSSISPGQQLNVFITRTHTATVLLGFMIQARTAAGVVHGQFLTTPGMRLMACTPVSSSATHYGPEQRATITLTWVPPPTGFVGNLVFT